MTSAMNQAEALKVQGNTFYQKERIGAAIDAYTEAIALYPKKAVYFTNRAQCYRKRNDWTLVESDCRKALELDKDSIKAHYMLGLSFLHFNHIKEAVKELEKALELARCGDCSSDFLDDIWKAISKARYTEWEIESSAKLEKNEKLRNYLVKIMNEDLESKKKKLLSGKFEKIHPLITEQPTDEKKAFSFIEKFQSFLKSNQNRDLNRDQNRDRTTNKENVSETDADSSKPPTDMDTDSQSDINMEDSEDKGLSPLEIEARDDALRALEENHKENLNELEVLFEFVNRPNKPAEIPDHLCCPITMDFFRDPVITPYGITYEKSALLEHLRRGRRTDPLSGKPIDENSLFPNLAMRESVAFFLQTHGWAFKTGL